MPEDLAPDELTPEKVEELLSAPVGRPRARHRPPDGREITAQGRPVRPVRHRRRDAPASLFKTMSLDTVTLDEAVQLLTLPRVARQDARRRGGHRAERPLRARTSSSGTDSRSLETEEQLFTVTLDEALALLRPAQAARPRGRRRAAAARARAPTRSSGKPMVVKDGRFGPYVTDGETNASLRKGDSVEELTDERAAELLADRRARGPAKKAARKAPAKKAAAKKTAAKKTAAKKAPAKAAAKSAE